MFVCLKLWQRHQYFLTKTYLYQNTGGVIARPLKPLAPAALSQTHLFDMFVKISVRSRAHVKGSDISKEIIVFVISPNYWTKLVSHHLFYCIKKSSDSNFSISLGLLFIVSFENFPPLKESKYVYVCSQLLTDKAIKQHNLASARKKMQLCVCITHQLQKC